MEGVCFGKHFVIAVGKTGHVTADSGFRHCCWRNRTRGRDFATPSGETGQKQDTWTVFHRSCWRNTFGQYGNYKLETIVIFGRNVRLRPIICQNTRN